jgi:hypothetical protein
MSDTDFSDKFKNERFFIPMVSVYTKPTLFKAIQPYTIWIGFNYFQLIHSKYYPLAKAIGLKKTFELDNKTNVFLSTAAKDKQLIKFYNKENGLETFKSDVKKLNVELVMGPDWFSYKEDPLSVRNEVIRKSIELNAGCLSIENLAPTIRGTNFQEMAMFIDAFKRQGVKTFVFTGREYLINLADRKRSQQEVFLLTASLARAKNIKLILTGCSSPRLYEKLSAVWGFASQGWLIEAMQRRLLKGKSYMFISNSNFFCNDSDCCASLSKSDLKSDKCDNLRAIHNLKSINRCLSGQKAVFSQACLEEF